MTTLQTLPPEIFQRIISYLPPIEIWRHCRHFRQVGNWRLVSCSPFFWRNFLWKIPHFRAKDVSAGVAGYSLLIGYSIE